MGFITLETSHFRVYGLCYFIIMRSIKDIEPNMMDYREEYSRFSLDIPREFSFPLDIFDRWSGNALFWTDGEEERIFSFRELTMLSSKGAGALRDAGIKRGDKVIVMLPNIPEWWEIMLALIRLNAIPIPATTLLTSKDLEYRLSATDIKAIVITNEDLLRIEDVINRHSVMVISVGDGKGDIQYNRQRDQAKAFLGERVGADEPALIYFTSGTTGPPKMVLHTQASYPLAHLITGKYWLDLRPGDLHWNVSDPGWAKAAWSSLFGPWHRGATVFSFYRKGRFDPALTVEIMKRYNVTTFCGPPTVYRMIAKDVFSKVNTLRLPVRHFVAAGEPLNKEIIELWKEKTGHYIYDGYGQTETVNVLANFRCLPVKPGAMGVPVPGFVVDIIDERGRSLPPGIEGDIGIKIHPERPIGLFKEYLGDPEATKKTVRGDWYVTGDRAYKDEEGYFWFVGRADDIILTSGYRIGPFEIESILIKHPAVKESAVTASPDEIRGEVVKAFIVLMEGYSPSESLVRDLQDFVKANTAPYKYPRRIEFVDELPKTISGKIKRKELRQREFGKV